MWTWWFNGFSLLWSKHTRRNHASNYSGNPSYFVHPGGNYIAHGGNAGGVSRPSPYAQSPLSDGRINGCLGCPGGAHAGSPHPTSSAVTNAGLVIHIQFLEQDQ